MVIVLVHLSTLVNVIWGGLALIVLSTVDVIITPPVTNNQEYVISVKIGPLDNFVNNASKLLTKTVCKYFFVHPKSIKTNNLKILVVKSVVQSLVSYNIVFWGNAYHSYKLL